MANKPTSSKIVSLFDTAMDIAAADTNEAMRREDIECKRILLEMGPERYAELEAKLFGGANVFDRFIVVFELVLDDA